MPVNHTVVKNSFHSVEEFLSFFRNLFGILLNSVVTIKADPRSLTFIFLRVSARFLLLFLFALRNETAAKLLRIIFVYIYTSKVSLCFMGQVSHVEQVCNVAI